MAEIKPKPSPLEALKWYLSSPDFQDAVHRDPLATLGYSDLLQGNHLAIDMNPAQVSLGRYLMSLEGAPDAKLRERLLSSGKTPDMITLAPTKLTVGDTRAWRHQLSSPYTLPAQSTIIHELRHRGWDKLRANDVAGTPEDTVDEEGINQLYDYFHATNQNEKWNPAGVLKEMYGSDNPDNLINRNLTLLMKQAEMAQNLAPDAYPVHYQGHEAPHQKEAYGPFISQPSGLARLYNWIMGRQ